MSETWDAWVDRLLDGHPLEGDEVPAELRTLSNLLKFEPDAATANAPEFIGPYRILETLGEGGMGSVYLAEQREPLRRLVALKVLRGGRRSSQLAARLELERQTLALMDHPNIATVFDAGVSELGTPYFAMEFVRGIDITEFVSEHELPLRDRLELFLPICAAVQHAHQRGVLHRDLKPSNLLVEMVDDRPVAKVIDFGIAKVQAEELEEPGITVDGQLLGTPEYMSPEQAAGEPVDVRSDVYALGVVLYQLLCERLPIAADTLREGGISNVATILRKKDPPAAGQINSALKGDLEWLLGRALEKEPEHRYAGAGDLAKEIERYLTDQPLEAGPPGAGYRVRKFARRHRVAVAFVSVVVALLVGGIGTTTWQAIRASRAEREAIREAKSAHSVSAFLTDMLRQANPGSNPAANLKSLSELLDEAALRIPDRFDDQPEVEAQLRYTLGQSYGSLHDGDKAWPHLNRALELAERHDLPDLAYDTRSSMVESYVHEGRLAEARDAADQLLATATERRGNEDWRTIKAMLKVAGMASRLGESAVADSLFRRGLGLADRISDGGHDNPHLLTGLSEYGAHLKKIGDLAAAEQSYRRAWDILKATNAGPTLNSATLVGNLASLVTSRGNYDEALQLYDESIDAVRTTVGDQHPSYAQKLHNRAVLYGRLDRFDEAEHDLEWAEQILRRHYPDPHPDLADVLSTWGTNLAGQERLDEAEAKFQEALGIRLAIGDSTRAYTIINNLSAVQRARGNYVEAEKGFRRARAMGTSLYGASNPQTIVATNNIARALEGQERWADANVEYQQAVTLAREVWSEQHANYGIILGNHGHCLMRSGRPAEARATLTRALDIVVSALGEEHSRAKRIQEWLAELGPKG